MRKSTIANNYLLIDYGNSCIKTAIYNKRLNKVNKYVTLNSNQSFNDVISKGKYKQFNKIVYISSGNVKKTSDFIDSISTICPQISIEKVTRKNFIPDIDLSNVDKNVVIGDDILLCAYYLIKNYKSNALFCLGTVYFCVITKGNKIVSVQLTPNITTGLNAISSSTSIPKNLIPCMYDKDIGLNTPNAFASGAKTMLDGYIQLVVKKHNLDLNQIIVSGGDCDKYQSLSKKYHFIKYCSLLALAQLTKDKNL